MSDYWTKARVILRLRYKLFNELNKTIKRLLKSLKSLKRDEDLLKLYKTIYKTINSSLKDIPENTIKLFYNDPRSFFAEHKALLENTSYYDSCGNSIFAHYFEILYISSKKGKNNYKTEIYESNFNSFFIAHKKFITMQDISLETPLQKLAK